MAISVREFALEHPPNPAAGNSVGESKRQDENNGRKQITLRRSIENVADQQ